MTILRVSQSLESNGQVGSHPAELAVDCDNTLTEVTTAGFLTPSAIQPYSLTAKDLVRCSYAAGVALFNVAIDSVGVITLSVNTQIDITTVAGDFAEFSNTTGALTDGGKSASDATKTKIVMANGTTVARRLAIFSDTDGTVDDTTTGSNAVSVALATAAQTTALTVPDPGAATANFMLNTGTTTMASGSQIILAKANGTESSNAVTASGNAGVITTSSLNTAAGGNYAITWTNTKISTTSVILLSVQGGTNTMNNYKMKIAPGSGTAILTIYNLDGSAALNGTILIGYQVV